MLYKDWSEEFGNRLESMTGIQSWFYKEYYEKSLVDIEKYIIAEEDFILPVLLLKDKYTSESIPVVMGDADFNQTQLLLNQPEKCFKRNGFEIIECSRKDLVVPLQSSFQEHKKSLSRVARHYNKCDTNLKYYIYSGLLLDDTHKELVELYSKYWEAKKETPINFVYFKHFLGQVDNLSPNNTYTIIVEDNGKTLALAYFEIINNEVYWHETIRDVSEEYEKFAIGNYVLLVALKEFCYPRNIPLNLGVSWFDYKKHWHPIEKNIRGIKFIK